MKCPICKKKGMKSCVYVGSTTSTLVYAQPYYDEDGNYHRNDPNTHTTSYSCSKSHKWIASECQDEETINIIKNEIWKG